MPEGSKQLLGRVYQLFLDSLSAMCGNSDRPSDGASPRELENDLTELRTAIADLCDNQPVVRFVSRLRDFQQFF